jgi:hypothetical protein
MVGMVIACERLSSKWDTFYMGMDWVIRLKLTWLSMKIVGMKSNFSDNRYYIIITYVMNDGNVSMYVVMIWVNMKMNIILGRLPFVNIYAKRLTLINYDFSVGKILQRLL